MQENMPNTNKKGYEVKREFYDKGFKRKELPNRYLNDRKTLAVCSACHHKIHSGRKLD